MKTEIQKKNSSKTLIKFPVLEGDSQVTWFSLFYHTLVPKNLYIKVACKSCL